MTTQASMLLVIDGLPLLWVLPISLTVFVVLGFTGARLWAWSVAGAGSLLALGLGLIGLGIYAGLALVMNLVPVRRILVSFPLLKAMRALGFLPRISETERTAIEAGTVWVDGELFSGKPDFGRILSEPYPGLTEEEQAFLDGPVEHLCHITSDWDVHQRRDLSPETWEVLKREGFLGLIIPKEYGGRGFSASANSAIVAKASSRSMTLGVTVMVPNSLGPAELLLHYGTEQQRQRWLPGLARGTEIPAFALTEPGAGSDAGAMTSSGEVFRGEDGKLYLRLNWNKRYITLAAISTVLGLAFKLSDPDDLLGKGTEPGITCALVPTSTPGVEIGRRHDPLGVPFFNCPTSGADVVVPIDAIIGEAEGAGRGWLMLMECLSAGRGVSLPASSTAGVKGAARIAGTYSAVRRQFGMPIGRFEGIHEPLARCAGWGYTLEAARRYTCGAIDAGSKPAVVTAMMKYNSTELLRAAMNDAMDVLGGAAISLGPRNPIGLGYRGIPVPITVEGANILTRTLMIFGQGAIRCHPYAYAEIKSAAENNVPAFDAAFWAHVGHVAKNGCRALVLSLTRGRMARVPVDGPVAPYLRKLSWASAQFAFFADLAMASLGGDLKRKETITGRFSDVFSWMYLASATARRFEAEGRPECDLPAFHWAMQHSLQRIQQGFEGLFKNLASGPLALVSWPVGLWSRLNPIGTGPSDALGSELARALQVPGGLRDTLTPGLYLPKDERDPLSRFERAFVLCVEADELGRKIRAAVKDGKLQRGTPLELLEQAVDAGVLSGEEADLVRRAEAARQEAIEVDSFTLAEYMGRAADPATDQTSPPGPTPGKAEARPRETTA